MGRLVRGVAFGPFGLVPATGRARSVPSESYRVKLGVFFERDGVLNQIRVEGRNQVGPLTLDQFHINQEAAPHLQKLKTAGFVLLAITHQPGLSRGYQSRRELEIMHHLLRRVLPLDDIFVCPHDESDRCPCRRPGVGLLREAAFAWHLNLDRSFVISDKWQDAEAARQAGCTSLMIASPWLGSAHHDLILPNLESAVGKILQWQTVNGPVYA